VKGNVAPFKNSKYTKIPALPASYSAVPLVCQRRQLMAADED